MCRPAQSASSRLPTANLCAAHCRGIAIYTAQTGFYPNTDTQFVPSAGSGPKTQAELVYEQQMQQHAASRQQQMQEMTANMDRFDQVLNKVGQ